MNSNFCFGKKIKRSVVESKPELVEKIVQRANADNPVRSIGQGTAVKRYTRYINSMEPAKYAHLYSPDDSVFFENEPDTSKKTKPATMNLEEAQEANIEIKLTKMKDQSFDANLFVPIKSKTAIDKIISNKEGTMPATNTIVLGDPGIGKTTVMLDLLANVQKQNPDKRCLFVSGEMNAIDLAEYMERIPGAEDLEIFFTMDYEENSHIALLKVLAMGWDIVLFDSFDEIKETVNEDLGLSSTKAEKWLIDIMVQQNLGKNDRGINTAFFAIQQVTKGGKFVGSNKLKHNTTAMLEIRYDKVSKEPKLYYTKNRRGNTDLEMFFKITPEGIQYDTLRFAREMEFKKKIEFDAEEQEKENDKFADIFGLKVDEDGNFIQEESFENEEIEDEDEMAIAE